MPPPGAAKTKKRQERHGQAHASYTSERGATDCGREAKKILLKHLGYCFYLFCGLAGDRHAARVIAQVNRDG